MKNLKMVVLMVLVMGTSISVGCVFNSVSAQVTTDNATNATMGTQAGAGNMTDKNTTGKISSWEGDGTDGIG